MSIQSTDRQALQLWNMIQNDSIYKDKTALFITNDHGRHCDGHKDGFVSHGGGCKCCRKISLVAIGPDFKKGKVVSEPSELIDIAATAAEILRIYMPLSKGRFMTDLVFDKE
jgi:arylsulfatase A-like enzyme